MLALIYLSLCLLTIIPPLGLYGICRKNNQMLLICYFLHFLLMVLLSVFLLEPGGFSPDVEFALDKARSGYWRDLHPHGLTMAFWLTERLIMPGPLPLLTIQIVLFAAGIIGIFAASEPKKVKHNIVMSSLVFFFPPSFTLFGMLWKDILHASIYVFAICLALCFRKLKDRYYRLISLYCCIILLAFGVFVRLNSSVAAFPIIIFTFWPKNLLPYIQLKKLILKLVLCTILVSIVLLMVHHACSDKPYYLASASMKRNELAYIAYKTGEAELLNFNTWANGLNFNMIQEIYNEKTHSFHYSSSPFVRSMKLFKTPWIMDRRLDKEITKIWLKAIFFHPCIWIKYKINNFAGLLGISVGPEGQANLSTPEVGKTFGFRVTPNVIAFKFWSNFIEPMQQNILMQPWIYFLLAFMVAISAYFLPFFNTALILCLSTSAILMECSFGLLVSHYEFRWSHYMIIMSVLALGIFIRDILISPKFRKS